MSIINEQDLEFAKDHISKYYDSDFFPKPVEYEALWHQWDAVKADLMSKNVGKIWATSPRAMTIAKPKGGFRVVHQLEPIETVVYTALAGAITPSIEDARMPRAEHIACSYRLAISDGNFFGGGSGWTDYSAKSEELAGIYANVLVTDITDFYNQIYLHRLNNAIELADAKLKPIADDIENFLSTINNKASQGIPVGPAASIVMAESVLIDVDRFIKDQGVEHTRYVDDFRIYSDSERELNSILEKLTLYLYENHRLTISSEKTYIMDAEEFVKTHLHNSYADEKVQLLETLEIYNPYTEEVEEIEVEVEEHLSSYQDELVAAIKKVISYEFLDLGLARSVIRTARRQMVADLVSYLLANFQFFAPVVNDVALYLKEVTDKELALAITTEIEELILLPALDNQLVRFWIEWYVAQYPEFMSSPKIHAFVFDGPNTENQALAAISTKNVAWVRNHKAGIYNLGGWARRAVLNSARVLPGDERTHWLKMIIGNSPVTLDRWVAKWVLETA
jgi:hypothetical protein